MPLAVSPRLHRSDDEPPTHMVTLADAPRPVASAEALFFAGSPCGSGNAAPSRGRRDISPRAFETVGIERQGSGLLPEH